MKPTIYQMTMPSPIGDLLLLSNGDALTGLFMEQTRDGLVIDPAWERDPGPFREVERQLLAYFEGGSVMFDLPIAARGTEFQHLVWAELRRVRFGERVSYGELARRIGRPGSSRAVGLANARNPISIVVPCHRVVGSSGLLTGYAGGLSRKKWLLDHEARFVAAREGSEARDYPLFGVSSR